jgi:hypothetical protein
MYMLARINQKILGAVVIGIALIGGAYTIAHFGEPRMKQPASVGSSEAPSRVAITVTDSNNNGIEDWRDEFVTTKPVIINQATTTYTAPTSITGQTGIRFFEDALRAKTSGPFARSQEEVVGDTVETLERQTRQELYNTTDISILESWTDEDIRLYANAMASAVINNDVKGLDSELTILNDALNNNKPERLKELQVFADIYKNVLRESLAIPVPSIFVKEHLDLINTYSAMQKNIEGMMLSNDDPIVALMRIKRYEDDTLGLRISLQNMYSALEPKANLFTGQDAATYFANYNPNNQF